MLGAPKSFPSESRILFACASVISPEERKNLFQGAIDDGVDLDLLERLALDNDLGPLLFRQAVDLEGVSSTARELAHRLRGNHDFNLRRSSMLLLELSRLLRLMEAEGVPVIPYKGPSFALRHYASPGLRPCGDLDLMVLRSDVQRATHILLKNGYQIRQRRGSDGADDPEGDGNEITMDHLENPLLTAELHWGLFAPGLLGMEDSDLFWEKCCTTELHGMPTRTLTTEAEFVVMALHGGVKHEWIPLRVLGDIARIVQSNPNLNWDAVKGMVV